MKNEKNIRYIQIRNNPAIRNDVIRWDKLNTIKEETGYSMSFIINNLVDFALKNGAAHAQNLIDSVVCTNINITERKTKKDQNMSISEDIESKKATVVMDPMKDMNDFDFSDDEELQKMIYENYSDLGD